MPQGISLAAFFWSPDMSESTETRTRLLEPASAEVDAEIQSHLGDGEDLLIRVYADLDLDGRFTTQWVAVTDTRVVVIPGWSASEPQVDGNGVSNVLIEDLIAVRTEGLVGGGRLELERGGRDGGQTLVVQYTSSQAVKFSEVARGLKQLRKEETFQINPRLDRLRCEQCGRLLPEKNGICPACIRKWHTLGRIISYIIPHKGRAILLALASVATTLAELMPPLITERLVDDVLLPQEVPPPNMDDRLALLGWLVIALVGVRVASWLAEFVHGWTVTWLAARVTADIRAHLYRRLEMLSLQFYDKRQTGALISRVTRDAGMLEEFLIEGVPYLLINGLMIFGIIAFMMSMSWKVTLLMLIPVPLMITWSGVFWRRMRRIFHKYGRGWSGLGSRLNEALNGIRVVKAFAQEERELGAFERKNLALSDISRKTARNFWSLFATMSLFSGFAMIIVWFAGGLEVLDGTLKIGTLLAMYSYMWMVYGPLEWLTEVNIWMTRAFAGAERIFEVIDADPEPYADPHAVAMPRIDGRVTFTDVTFGYDKSKPVLHDVNLDVEPGEMIGLVGKSGVGKTTTVNLISRFYDVDQGQILVDGVSIGDIKLQDLRRQIGIVQQAPVLFSGSIADNIGYGKPEATFEEIVGAAKAANAHQFICAKGDGYDTRVSERGDNLSGGEKQRIAIARAVLHDPAILILDEATSSVDVETEKQIQESIFRLIEGRTTFAIAHRISTLKRANRLAVLEAGRIVEIGSHDELMAARGRFYDLVELQQAVSEIIAVKD